MKDNAAKSKLLGVTLKDSENLFLSLVDRMIDAVVIIDWDGTILFANKAMAKLVGIGSSADCIGLNILKFTHPDFCALVINDLHLVKNGNRGSSADYRSFKLKPRTGEEKWVEGTGTMVYFGGNTASLVILGNITIRKQAEDALKKREEELMNKTRMLEEVNTALRVLLQHREEDKEELEKKVSANIKELVIPYIEMLKRSPSDTRTVECIAILESNLKNITSPFSRQLSSNYIKLTPKEILVANLIKDGKTTKEMAGLLTITSASIDTHRNSIRNKLGLNDKKISLRTYLLSAS